MGSSSGVTSLEHTPLNASLFYACSQNSGTNFSGSRGVAQGARVGVSGVLVHSGLSEGGNIRLGAADATSRGFRPCQHCGRISPAWKSRQSTLYEMAEASLEESRYYLILAQDLGYGDTSSLTTSLEEVSRLLNAYTKAILASDS